LLVVDRLKLVSAVVNVAFRVSTGLLATTLFTFQDYACDNDLLRMRCPRDTVISVQWAQYGRLATSSNNDICPAVTWKPLSELRAAAAAAYLRHPSPRTDWLSPSSVSMTTVPMATAAVNNSGLRRAAAAERITCLASKSLEVSAVIICFLISLASCIKTKQGRNSALGSGKREGV